MGLLGMGALLVVGALAFSAVVAMVSMLVWLVLLPFRLVFFVLKLIVLTLAGAVGLGLLLVAGVVALVVLGVAILAPLLPIVLAIGLFWLVARAMRRPARA